jgi:hypothetical protein
MSGLVPFTRVEEVTNADDVAVLSCSEAIRGLNRQISLFTPALMITSGGFDRDPVMEFDARFPAESADLRPFCIDLKPSTSELFFSGLGMHPLPGRNKAVNWDKRLYGIAQQREEECFAFLSGIAFSHADTGYFASTFSYPLEIPDPTSKFNELLQVRVFGIVSNQFIALLERRVNGPPVVRHVPVPNEKAALNFLQQNGILSAFTGDNPLIICDEI